MLTCLIHQVAAEPAAATAVPGQETIAEEPEAEAAAATEVTYSFFVPPKTRVHEIIKSRLKVRLSFAQSHTPPSISAGIDACGCILEDPDVFVGISETNSLISQLSLSLFRI